MTKNQPENKGVMWRCKHALRTSKSWLGNSTSQFWSKIFENKKSTIYNSIIGMCFDIGRIYQPLTCGIQMKGVKSNPVSIWNVWNHFSNLTHWQNLRGELSGLSINGHSTRKIRSKHNGAKSSTVIFSKGLNRRSIYFTGAVALNLGKEWISHSFASKKVNWVNVDKSKDSMKSFLPTANIFRFGGQWKRKLKGVLIFSIISISNISRDRKVKKSMGFTLFL